MPDIRGWGKRIHGSVFIENSSEGFALLDEQGRITYCNRASETITGCPPEVLAGRVITDCVHAEDKQNVRAVLRQCMQNPGQAINASVRLRHCNGSYRLVECVFNSQLDDPEIESFVCNYREVTQTAAAEQSWRESEARFATAFRSSPVAIAISTQAEGRYLDVNDAFLQMLSLQRADVVGRTSIELNIWADPQDRALMIEYLAGHRLANGLRATLKSSRGEIRYVNIFAELIELEGVPCVLGFIEDLTEATQLENQFRQAQKMEPVGRLASGIAHDFNNLLGVILGYCEISIQRLGRESSVTKSLMQIKGAADRATLLTQQLLAFTRKQILHPRILDFNRVVPHLNEMALRMIGEDIALTFTPAAERPYVQADPGQIDQILLNLIVNARDAMPDGGRIAISTSNVDLEESLVAWHGAIPPGCYVVLSVADTGCGMDAETLSHIFEPFYTTKGPGKGTGLGLSTVYGIVRQSGGDVCVYSEPGVGTIFKLYFPRSEKNTATAEKQCLEKLESEGGSETILLVEDDQSLRDVTADMLESGGYSVLQASDAVDALSLLQQSDRPIHLLLTDVLMPGMNGGDLARQLKKLRPNLNVLLMSGYAGETVPRGQISPDLPLLQKPFTRCSLLSTVYAALHASSHQPNSGSMNQNVAGAGNQEPAMQ